MDRAYDLLPIVVDNHDLPAPLDGEVVRRRGRGYRRVTVTLPPPAPGSNREARRRAGRAATAAARAARVAPLAALLLAPVALAASPAAAAPATTTTTTASATTSTSAPDEPTTTTSSTTTTTTTVAATSTTTTAVPPTPTSTTPPPPAGRPGTTTTAAPPATDPPTTGSPPHVTSPATSSPAVSATVVPSTTTSSSSTTVVPGAVIAPPVGTAELPPATPADADPIAVSASQALAMHHELVGATRTLIGLTDGRAAADAEAARLEARTSELTAHAFDVARAGQATAEVELARSNAQKDLDAARAASAAMALRQAASATAVDDLSARYPTARLLLATLVAKPLGADPAKLDAAWAAAVDARVDVVYAALAQIGDPYVWATSGPDEFDCSGLTAFAWKAAGVVLPHHTVLQRQAALDATEGTLRPGDLVFNLDGPNGGHVQLYLGTGRLVVHAPSTGHNVSVTEYRATTGFGSPMDDTRSLGEAASTTIGDVPSH